MVNMGRRYLLSSVGEVGKSALGGALGTLGAMYFLSVHEKYTVAGHTREIMDALFGRDRGEVPAVYAGEGNVRKTDAAGNPLGLSHFMHLSSERFTNIVSTAHDLPHMSMDIDAPIAEYDPGRDTLILGGPPSNGIARELLGYCSADESKMPIRRIGSESHPLRWYQDYGLTDWGTFEDGKPRLATRYDKGKPVERAVFRMYDKKTGQYIDPLVKGGMLYEEWLTIVKVKQSGSTKVLVGGFHGHSSEAFVRSYPELIANLERLVENTEGIPEFQMIVPVTLEHPIDAMTGRSVTNGKLNWDSAELESFESRG